MKEDEMVGWHHQLDGYESEQAPGVGDVQRCLVCCSSWGHKELDMISCSTELNKIIKREKIKIAKNFSQPGNTYSLSPGYV